VTRNVLPPDERRLLPASGRQRLPATYERDLAAAERHARETLIQCEHLRRNGPTDLIRFGLIASDAWAAWRAAARADRRWARSADDRWVLRWRLPRGYGDGS
jgi:hypothetical protein